MDFMSFVSLRLKAPRRAECAAPDCSLIRDLPREERDIEIALSSLAAAAPRFELIDVRTAEEFSASPTPSRHIPLAELLAESASLDPGVPYLLLCASGKRSLTAARELRKRGFDVRSLAGGLQALDTAEHA
jgi:rhodanese-related sulfurtransferase